MEVVTIAIITIFLMLLASLIDVKTVIIFFLLETVLVVSGFISIKVNPSKFAQLKKEVMETIQKVSKEEPWK